MTPATSTPDRPQLVPLSSLREGQHGIVHGTELTCEDCELLCAMGLSDQCEFRVCRRGEPCIVQVDQTRLGLSSAMSRRILVRPRGGAD